METKTITFAEVLELRKVAESQKGDFPHLPLLLELAISGLSRTSIAGLTINDIVDGEINWQNRHNVWRAKKLSRRQIEIYEEYMEWRKRRQTQSKMLFLVRNTHRQGQAQGYFFPIKPERVRSDIRSLGKDIGIDFQLEIPHIKKAVADYLILNGVDNKIISKYYK